MIIPTTLGDAEPDPATFFSDGSPIALMPRAEQQSTQDIQALLAEDASAQAIAAKVQQMPLPWRVHAFSLMPQQTAEAVYGELTAEAQQLLLETFKQQPMVGILNQLSLEERHHFFGEASGSETAGAADAVAPEDELPETEDYFEKSLVGRVKQRVFWLFALLVANLGTTIAIQSQEDVIERMAILAAFIPLLIGSGGNVTTQSATVMIRELSQDGASIYQSLRRVLSEAIAGLWIGLILGILMVGLALLLKGSLAVALVVGVSLLIITSLSTIFGAILPLVFKALGFDPAMMSAPLSATIVDVLGVLIYLSIARSVI